MVEGAEFTRVNELIEEGRDISIISLFYVLIYYIYIDFRLL